MNRSMRARWTRAELERMVDEQAARLLVIGAERDAAQAGLEIRRMLTTTVAAATLEMPRTRALLLQSILDTACRVLGTRAGSLFLVDEQASELTFEAVVGPEAPRVASFAVPMGKGLVGWSAATGQALAVADAADDGRFYSEIGKSVGYIPRSILCVPMVLADRVIGVLELLDRHDGAPFSPGDIELGSLFATQAAIAIDQSQLLGNLLGFLTRSLGVQSDTGGAEHDRLLGAQLETLATSDAHRDALAVAELIAEAMTFGPAAGRLCRDLLGDVVRYLRAQPSLSPLTATPPSDMAW